MRDPFTWSFPLGRLFGISIRVHVLFPLFAVGMVLSVAALKDPPPPAPPWPSQLWLDTIVILALGFLAVLLHEFGHYVGARLVDGDVPEMMLWPLGGLAPVEVPHTPRAHLITAIAGPLTNLVLCVAVTLLLAAYSLRPTLNVWSADADPLAPRLYRWTEAIYYGTSYHPGDPTEFTAAGKTLTRDQVDEKPLPPREPNVREAVPREKEYVARDNPKEKATPTTFASLERWQIMAARFFWVNWVLFLMNLLPGFPLDGGRILQSILWWRGEYRQSTLSAVFVGFVVMLVCVLYAMAVNSVLPVLLAWFIYDTCKRQWYVLETGGEEPMFGYDFSQGYTSLEREPPSAAARPKRPNFFQRWLQKRAARKLQREQEEREAEEHRLDELLAKVQRDGVQSLTEEERRFLTRVSSRYKNKR